MHAENVVSKNSLGNKIAGEIVLSPNTGETIQKWRNIFKISQRQLAREMSVMPSVISDYESGRRKSPGVKMVKKIVDSLLNIDEKEGGKFIKEFTNLQNHNILNDSILDIREFPQAKRVSEFVDGVNGVIVVGKDQIDKQIYGYTIIDSLKAITELSPTELVRLYGLTTERAMIFTKTTHGRSPLIAIKVTNLKPGVVILHGFENISDFDKLAERIAVVEKIPIIISKLKTVEELINNLKKIE